MKYMTVTTLIEDIKRRGSIPQNQQTFLESDFLAFANEELDLGVVPHVLSFHEEYFVYSELVDIQPNTARYQVPTRAVGSKLRDIAYQDESGNLFEMSRITVDELPSYQNNVIQNSFTLFYVEGSEIVLVPETGPTPTGFLKFSYYLRPNELVSEDRVAIITSIDRTTGDVAVSQVPSIMVIGEPLDLVQTKSPHRTLLLDAAPVSINNITKVINFDPADLPTALAVGDQVALAGECIVPQIPSDLHGMLSQRVVARCLESMGDQQGLGAANAKLAEMEVKTGNLISNRVEGAPQKIVNRHSILKRNKLYWRY